ncbi:MAG TPA: 50S ribosomal protein L23 [Candidatus Saccharimonadales bacterium]|nr:50S ribosomal protein L23 [Candidatus Saccharimonadales bacterium]
MSKNVTLLPRIMSEKAYRLSHETRTYIFDIPQGLNKQSVARAVAAQFDVTVTNVNIANKPGKAKRTLTKRRQAQGRDVASRRAYVTVAEGQSLPIFAAVEEAEEKQEAIQEKVEKATAKQAAKEAKASGNDAKPAKKLSLKRSGKKKEEK